MINFLRSLCTVLLLPFAVVGMAQEIKVTKVIPESSRNQPLKGVTVKVSGTNSITNAGTNAGFTSMAESGEVQKFSFAGYASQGVTDRGQNSTLSLQNSVATGLDEAVTAIHIKINSKVSGYAMQKVEGAEIQQT